MTKAELIEQMEAAVKALEPPFLALPELGQTAEQMAYRRGVRDAYRAALEAIAELPDER
jgi:hypothetical protein